MLIIQQWRWSRIAEPPTSIFKYANEWCCTQNNRPKLIRRWDFKECNSEIIISHSKWLHLIELRFVYGSFSLVTDAVVVHDRDRWGSIDQEQNS